MKPKELKELMGNDNKTTRFGATLLLISCFFEASFGFGLELTDSSPGKDRRDKLYERSEDQSLA